MRAETDKRLRAAAGQVGKYNGQPGEGKAEAETELRMAKVEYGLEKLVDAGPPLTKDQRDRICAFLASIP